MPGAYIELKISNIYLKLLVYFDVFGASNEVKGFSRKLTKESLWKE